MYPESFTITMEHHYCQKKIVYVRVHFGVGQSVDFQQMYPLRILCPLSLYPPLLPNLGDPLISATFIIVLPFPECLIVGII